MALNANKKFINTLLSRVEDFNLVSKREINDIEELKSMMKNGVGFGWSIDVIDICYELLSAKAVEYTYDNGLKYLVSRIMYVNKTGSIREKVQHTLTKDYEEAPIINIEEEKVKKSMMQFLLSKETNESSLFNELDLNIEGLTTCIHVNNDCGSIFESYVDTTTDKLLVEKYEQFYPMTKFDELDTDLLKICGCGSRKLEIMYNKDCRPMYADFSDDRSVRLIDFDPNSSVDAALIESIINREVSEIVNAMNKGIDNSLIEDKGRVLKP